MFAVLEALLHKGPLPVNVDWSESHLTHRITPRGW